METISTKTWTDILATVLSNSTPFFIWQASKTGKMEAKEICKQTAVGQEALSKPGEAFQLIKDEG